MKKANIILFLSFICVFTAMSAFAPVGVFENINVVNDSVQADTSVVKTDTLTAKGDTTAVAADSVKAEKKKALSRALGCEIPAEIYDRLREAVSMK